MGRDKCSRANDKKGAAVFYESIFFYTRYSVEVSYFVVFLYNYLAEDVGLIGGVLITVTD